MYKVTRVNQFKAPLFTIIILIYIKWKTCVHILVLGQSMKKVTNTIKQKYLNTFWLTGKDTGFNSAA